MVEKVTLYFKEGGSDKVYDASLEEKGDGYVVNFAYGRRGDALKTGTKTKAPLPLERAKKIYDKLVASKTSKGYTPGEDGTPYVGTDHEARDTGLRPQLLNFIEEKELDRYLRTDGWWAQEKHDGKRAFVWKTTDGAVIGANRRGLEIGLPKPIVEAAKKLGDRPLLDGELVGDVLFAFDLMGYAGYELHDMYAHRLANLRVMVGNKGAIRAVETAVTEKEKRALLKRLRAENKEGIVFKLSTAAYKSGRPASGGDWVKFKFYATATCLVTKGREGKRSVALELLDGKKRIGVGNVTVPANQPVPEVGNVVETRYLYAYKGGSLFQPTLLGIRDDMTEEDCLLSQLKYKAEA